MNSSGCVKRANCITQEDGASRSGGTGSEARAAQLRLTPALAASAIAGDPLVWRHLGYRRSAGGAWLAALAVYLEEVSNLHAEVQSGVVEQGLAVDAPNILRDAFSPPDSSGSCSYVILTAHQDGLIAPPTPTQPLP